MKTLLSLAALGLALFLTSDAQAFGGRSRVVVNNAGFGGRSVVVNSRGFGGRSVIINNGVGGAVVPAAGFNSFNSFQSFGGSCGGFGSRVLIVP